MSEQNNVKPGEFTTEYQAARNGSFWGIVAMVLGVVVSLGSTLVDALGGHSRIGIVVGGIIAALGVIQKTLVDLGYIKSRTDVKAAASLSPGATNRELKAS